MRKLTLNLDDLVVETFRTMDGGRAAGTVHGAGAYAGAYDSSDSDCANCWSADPCTNIPVDTCTCGCDAGTAVPQGAAAGVAHSGCAATSECTCTPIETCSCVAP